MKNIIKIAEAYVLSRTVYKIFLVLSTMLIAIPYIREKIGFIINIMMVYGFVILGYELIKGKLLKTLRTTKTSFLLGGFLLSYIITILINKTHIIGGLKTVAFMFLLFVLCFLFPEETTKNKIIKEMKAVSGTIVASTFILSLISFIMYVLSVSGIYFTGNGTYQASYGMFEGRLWGVYNPNTGATLTIISVILSLAFVIIYKKKRIRIPLIINIALQFSVLILTGSRAGYYVLAGATAFAVFFAIVNHAKNFKIKTMVISITSAALSLGIFLTVGFTLKEGLAYLPGLTQYVFSISDEKPQNNETTQDATQDTTQEAEQQTTKINKVDLNRPGDPNFLEANPFANRIDIWQACFQEFLESPVFGVGRENVVEKSVDNLKDKGWTYCLKFGNTHNIYLCVLVSSGIIGFMLIGAFAVGTVSRSTKTVVKTYKNINIWFLAAFVLCIMMFATEFVESRILYKIGIFSTVFWLYCGYMYKLSKIERTEKSNQTVLK